MDELTPPEAAPRRFRPRPGIAWGLITFLVLASLVAPRLIPSEAHPETDDGGVMLQMQGKTLAAGADRSEGIIRRMYLRQAEQLSTGPVGQRQRAIILLGDIGGPEVAASHLGELDDLIEQHNIELTEEQARVQEILRVLYAPQVPALPQDVARPRVELLDQADRDALVGELAWFGELALVPPEMPDRRARRDLLRGPMFAAVIVSLVIFVLILLGLGGAVGLIVLLVFAFSGRLGSGLAPGGGHHGIYAETFALWMALLFGLQVAGFALGDRAPEHRLFIMFLLFFVSLIALAWPVVRGVPWRTMCKDVGLNVGRRPAVEGLIGAGGYAMALPLFALGIVIMLVLMSVDALVRRIAGVETHPLDPDGALAHPVFDALAEPGLWMKIQLVLLVAVAAPIVEEIMFRGVFYRHVRDGLRSRLAGAAVPIVGAAAITAFIFAVVHPVPWFAWPALMGLAIAFALIREWRGTVFPSILMHAFHNGAIALIVLTMMSA